MVGRRRKRGAQAAMRWKEGGGKEAGRPRCEGRKEVEKWRAGRDAREERRWAGRERQLENKRHVRYKVVGRKNKRSLSEASTATDSNVEKKKEPK